MDTTDPLRPQSGAPFVRETLVRFADCDPAGIVFYPRYFEKINGLVEDWCAQGLGVSFRQLHVLQKMGLPTVHIETDFPAPSELGDVLRAELQVEKIGGASVFISVRFLSQAGQVRVRAKLVLVLMDLERRRAVNIPEAMRANMARFCCEGPAA